MLSKTKVIESLEAKKGRFTAFEVNLADDLTHLEAALNVLGRLSRAELDARLAGIPWPGARATDEFSDNPGMLIPFEQRWDHHEQARIWAKGVLAGVPTFAADGSQLPPSKDFSIPVAAVQIGWFENPHDGSQMYIKALEFDVLTPDELSGDPDRGDGFPDWRVNLRRFQGEAAKLAERMEAARGAAVKPICFFDGSLVLSFVQHLRPDRQRAYIDAVLKLLEVSERTRVPLIGYVDTSYAKDLVDMLTHIDGNHHTPPISDGALLRPRMNWGDRTPALVCARDDTVLAQYGAYAERVGFVYLKTTSEGSPARLDVPLWLLEEGILESTLDVVRAECVVGTGYPYAVETADAVAVITIDDREQFYRIFQEFAEKENLALHYSRKALSKRQRR